MHVFMQSRTRSGSKCVAPPRIGRMGHLLAAQLRKTYAERRSRWQKLLTYSLLARADC